MAPTCIDDTVLSDFLAGRISADQASEVESHLAVCSKCQGQAARHSSQFDSLLAAARSAVVSDPLEKEPELAVALSAIGRLRSPRCAGFEPTRAATPEIHNYRLIEKLGEGGMGTVYRAVHVHLEKTVALKIMKADRSGNPQAVSRFEREMKAIGRLEHPHIIRALDAGEQGGVYFLVMEYVAGIDLDQLIRSLGPLPVADACEIARQAALGLAHAHEHNLVHRDVKPSNLMLSPEGQVKVLDLGLAQFQQSTGGLDLTVEGQMIGTLLYMSPEQLAGAKNVDHRSDIFSLGVTLYCLLAGGLPLERGQPAAMLPEIGKVRTDIPPEVQTLLTKLLAPAPEDRLGSMSRVAELLKPLGSGRPLTSLVKMAQKRPTDRTALPPSLLPSRLPPVQTLAAQVTTTRAAGDVTLVAPASDTVLAARRAASSPITGWIAAGLASIALAVVVVVMSNPEPRATPVAGSVQIVQSDPADDRWTEYADTYCLQAIDIGGHAIGLKTGANPLPPGNYRLVCLLAELQLPQDQISIAAGQTQRVEISLPVRPPVALPEPSYFASIPEGSGPIVRYTGTLWYEGLPTEADASFRLTLRAKDEEQVGGVPHRWIEVEATTLTPTGDYTEKGLLLVDAARNKREQELLVKAGWVSAESESLKERLANHFPDQQLERVVVEYDNRADYLDKRAKELSLFLPPERLSIQHALVLLFPAPIPTAPKPLRNSRVFVANDRQRKEAQETWQGKLCHVIRSAPSDPATAPREDYLIATSSTVPFGLFRLDLTSQQLKLQCSYVHSDDTRMPAPPDKASYVQAAELVAALERQQPDPIGVAILPPGDGALASYSGTLERDDQPQIAFEVLVRSAGTDVVDGTTLRTIEVRALTEAHGNVPRHVEEAVVRIDAGRYRQNQFEIRDGWFRALEETFPFDPRGNLLSVKEGPAVKEGLAILGKRLPENRLGVHDALGLLFDAKLNESATGNLRGAVQQIIIATGQDPVLSETQAPMRGKPSVTADLWTLKTPVLDYVICRSRSIPFDFYTVNLQITNPVRFKIVTGLTDYQPANASPLLEEGTLLASAAAATQRNVLRELGTDQNVRVWRLQKGPLLFAEFAGTLASPNAALPGTIVFLEHRGEGTTPQIMAPLLHELSKEDQEWVAQGRHWKDGQRSQYLGKSSIQNKVTIRRKRKGLPEEKLPYEQVFKEDRDWIDRLDRLRREAAAPVPRAR